MKNVGNFAFNSSLLMALLGFGCSPQMPSGDTSLALRAVAPAAGPTAGGFELSLDGDNFEVGARVTVGGVDAEQVSVTSPTHLTAILPANPGSWGPVALTVTNPDGQLASRSDLFAYYASQPAFTGNAFPVSTQPSSVIVNDFNRDHTSDIVMIHRANNCVSLLLSNGGGGISASSIFPAGPEGNLLQAGVTADFNGDGNLDLAVTSHPGMVSVNLGDGRGRFRKPAHFDVGSSPNELAFADFNGDQKLDLVVTDWGLEGTISVLLGDGEGGFAAPTKLSVETRSLGLGVGDFNGDQKMDFVVADADSKIHVLIGDGKGGFSDIVTSLDPFNVSSKVTVGDFNQDNKLDIAMITPDHNDMKILLGNGVGGFSSLNTFPTGKSPQSVTLGDFNGDDLDDLAVTNLGDRSVSVMLGNGKGVFSTATILAVSDSPYGIAAGDFNGDRKLDLAVGNGSYYDRNFNGLSIWINQSR